MAAVKKRRAIAASDYMRLPVDVPVTFRLHRLVQPVERDGVMGLCGWTLEMEVTKGPTLYLRVEFLTKNWKVLIRDTPDSTARLLAQGRRG